MDQPIKFKPNNFSVNGKYKIVNKQTRCILDLQIVDLGDRMIGGVC